MTPEEIKGIRQKFGISQNALARVLGVAVLTVQRWESGKTKPSPMAVKSLEVVARKKHLRL